MPEKEQNTDKGGEEIKTAVDTIEVEIGEKEAKDKAGDKYPQTTAVMEKITDKDKAGEWVPHDFKRIYAKAKTAEEKVEKIDKNLTEKTEALKLLQDHNEKLSLKMEKLVETQTKLAETEIKENEEKTVLRKVDEFGERKKKLLEEKQVVFEEQDFKKLAAIDDQLFEIKLEERDLKQKKEDPVENKATDKSNSDFKDFIAEKAWANQDSKEFDPVIFGAVDSTEVQLRNNPLWAAKSIRERLDEAERLVMEKFNGGNNNARKNTGSPVEGKTFGNAGHKKTVTLTKEQVETSTKMGVPLERYAANLTALKE